MHQFAPESAALTDAKFEGLIEQELKENPQGSNRQVAAELGVDDKTVGAARAELVAIAEIPQSTRVERKDGGTYPASKPIRTLFVDDTDGDARDDLAARGQIAHVATVKDTKEPDLPPAGPGVGCAVFVFTARRLMSNSGKQPLSKPLTNDRFWVKRTLRSGIQTDRF